MAYKNKEDQKKWRAGRIELERAQARERYRNNPEKYRLKNQKRRRLYGDKIAAYRRRKYKENPTRDLLYSRMHVAIKTGRLVKATWCEICGSVDRIEAHHESYTKENELNVKWVCSICHDNIHGIGAKNV